MGLKLCSLSSGSKGNCIIVASDTTTLLIDAGIAVVHILKGLKLLNLENPSVLITHAHSDHIGNLPALSRKFCPKIYCHKDSFFAVNRHIKGGELMGIDSEFFIGDLKITPFKVSHDVPCVGYSVYNDGRKISIVTDIGCVDNSVEDALYGSDIVLIEANHDEGMVKNNMNYPEALKQRILSNRGHLSNETCAKLLAKVINSGVKQVVLGHMSADNNRPQLAYDVICKELNNAGKKVGVDVGVALAYPGKASNVFEVN
ncbi:MAG: MBL fold metallo-hydrolase [Firmicutes bacterium]|nr:MBL fold metallo-hydrolase [Bacillota bacterium]